MKKMKNDNKGFTLVELIVVLVILAILAAILVPALLGYIDEAKQKQIVLNGKSVYTAAQAVASELYAKKDNNEINAANFPTASKLSGTDTGSPAKYTKKILDIADVVSFNPTQGKIIIGFKGTEKHDKYTVNYIYYQEATDKAVELLDGVWTGVTAPTISTTGTDDTTYKVYNITTILSMSK